MNRLGFAPASSGEQSIQPVIDSEGFITGWTQPTTAAPAGGFLGQYRTVIIIAAAALLTLAIIKALQGGRR